MGNAIGIILLIGIYFLPSFIAYKNDHRQTTQIVLTNFFFGWTVLGWIIALIWSAGSDR